MKPIDPQHVNCPYCFVSAGRNCESHRGKPHASRVKKAARWSEARDKAVLDGYGYVVVETDYEWVGHYWRLSFRCDFCDDDHHHGGGDNPDEVVFGSRVPHCGDWESPVQRTKFLLVPGKDLTEDPWTPDLQVWTDRDVWEVRK